MRRVLILLSAFGGWIQGRDVYLRNACKIDIAPPIRKRKVTHMKYLFISAYIVTPVIVIILIYFFAGISNVIGSKVSFSDIMAALALIVSGWAFTYTAQSQYKMNKENRPQLTANVSSISFPKANQPPVTSNPFIFTLQIANSGNQSTQVVNCWLIPDGKTRKSAYSLFLEPNKLSIQPRQQETLVVTLPSFEETIKFHDLWATLVLRCADGREYEIPKI